MSYIHSSVPPPFAAICKHFSLGKLYHPPQEIPGGLLHQVWHIKTTHGEFAVKRFNLTMRNLQSNILLSSEHTQQIACQVQAHGIDAVVALQPEGRAGIENHHALNIDQQCIMVFPWIKGFCLNAAAIAQPHATAIGQQLAKIHNLDLPVRQYTAPLWGSYPAAEWEELAAHIQNVQIQELAFFTCRLPQLIQWSEKARSALLELNQNLVLSHRDLSNTNVLWPKNTKPMIIDWEYAGPINPQLERLIVAFNWSAITSRNPQQALFQGVMDGYDAITRHKKIFPHTTVLSGYIGYVLDWIVFNCRQAISMPEHRRQACEEVLGSLRALDAIQIYQRI